MYDFKLKNIQIRKFVFVVIKSKSLILSL